MEAQQQKTSVLVITPQYEPDFGPSAPIYTGLCEDLSALGDEVTVVTGFPHYAGAEAYYHADHKWIAEDQKNGVRILRTFVYKVPKRSLWRRLLYHLSFNLFSTLAALRVKKVDMIIADAPSLWSGLPLLVKAIFPGVPYVYVVHDIYPDVMVNLGVLHNPSMVRWIERIENFFYKKCAKVSVLSTGFKDNLIHKGVPAEKIEVVPVCVDVDFIRPIEGENQLREKWGLKDKYVVLYAGNMGLSQGLENVIKAAQLLKNHAEIEFILVGEGATRQELQQMIDQLDLHNVQLFSFLPREEVPWLYDLADVGLVSLKKGIVVESVPSKTYSIMASGRPFIATVDRDTEIGHLLDEAQCGLWVEPENPEALARAILQIYEDQASGLEMGKRARNFVVEHFSRQVAANQYQQMIVQRLNGR